VVVSGLYRAIFGLIGLTLVLVPGLYILSVCALIPVLPVLEPGMGAWRAPRRSAALTRGDRGLAFGTYVSPYACVFGAKSLLSMIAARFFGPQAGRLLGGLVGSCVALAMTPFLASIQVRLYVELHMRKEALDIESALASTRAAAAT
jgi:hypothetical protein